ncbi:MAG: sigma-70 family RNA polymerase sigma factor [Myxococcota bacterium]
MKELDQAYVVHRQRLWGVCYRMLGSGIDADEVVQDTFVRAVEHRPGADRSLWPWLAKVAVNLARDRLRRRQRRTYDGPWLPSVVATDGLPGWLRGVELGPGPEAAATTRSEVDYAWLVALEALTPNQRAVLVLRQVLDLSSAETAQALGLSESNVRITLHRARKALEAVPTPSMADDSMTLVRFAEALRTGDLDALLAVLVPHAEATTDAGGEYHAARRIVVGAAAVARLYLGLWTKSQVWRPSPQFRQLNARPAVTLDMAEAGPGFAPRSVTLFDIRDGRIHRTWSVLASAKLA